MAHVKEPRQLKFADLHLTTFGTVHKTEHKQKSDIVFLHPGDRGAGSSTPDLPMLPSTMGIVFPGSSSQPECMVWLECHGPPSSASPDASSYLGS